LILKYPKASLYDDEEFLNLEDEYLFNLITRCIDKIYYKDSVYEASDYKNEELQEFLENLDLKTFENIKNFLEKTPSVKYDIKYTNSLGNEKIIELRSLSDFFSLR
jgi:hypothetical protein